MAPRSPLAYEKDPFGLNLPQDRMWPCGLHESLKASALYDELNKQHCLAHRHAHFCERQEQRESEQVKQREEEGQKLTWNKKAQLIVLAGFTLAIKLAYSHLLGSSNLLYCKNGDALPTTQRSP